MLRKGQYLQAIILYKIAVYYFKAQDHENVTCQFCNCYYNTSSVYYQKPPPQVSIKQTSQKSKKVTPYKFKFSEGNHSNRFL